MIIAVPVNRASMDSEVCPSFGRAPYFMVLDTLSKGVDFMENKAAESAGGAGVKAAQALIDLKVTAIVAPRYGENAAEVLNAAGIKVFKDIPGSALENAAACEKNELCILCPQAGLHNHGAR